MAFYLKTNKHFANYIKCQMSLSFQKIKLFMFGSSILSQLTVLYSVQSLKQLLTMNKIFANDSKAVFEDDMHIGEVFDEVFKQIHEQENEVEFVKLAEHWTAVEKSEKKIVKRTNHLLKNEVLENSIKSEKKKLVDAEAFLYDLKKRQLELVRQYKDKQSKILSSLDHVENLIHMDDADTENDQKKFDAILRSYENELREMKDLIIAKKRVLLSE